LIVRNDRGADTIVKTEYIAILEGPRAAFDFVATEGFVSFENNSEEANDYFWDFGNDSTSTDVNPSIEYTETGDYPVVLMAMNECGVDTSTQTVSIMIDAVVQNQLQAELKLFPNPTSSLLTIAWEGLEAGHYQFNVVDNLGQVVLRRSVQVGAVNDQLIMDMSALSPGVYYLNIENGIREAVLRFIIL
jgi:PKD repeat protein